MSKFYHSCFDFEDEDDTCSLVESSIKRCIRTTEREYEETLQYLRKKKVIASSPFSPQSSGVMTTTSKTPHYDHNDPIARDDDAGSKNTVDEQNGTEDSNPNLAITMGHKFISSTSSPCRQYGTRRRLRPRLRHWQRRRRMRPVLQE